MNKMNMTLALIASAMVFTAFANNVPAKKDEKEDPAVRAARIKEKKRVFLGDVVRKPDSMKGTISIVSAQEAVPCSEISDAVELVRKTGKFNFQISSMPASNPWNLESVANICSKNGAQVTIFIVDDDKTPASLVAPEEHWAVINVRKVGKGLPDNATLRKRMLAIRTRREFIRTFVLLCGGGASQFPGNLMDAAKVEDLDTVEEFIPVDIPPRYTTYLEKIGVTPAYEKFYYLACKEGWAPQPTNEIQQAIWNRVKERKERGPTNPIHILPPKAK